MSTAADDPWRDRPLTVTFTGDEYRRLIHADHLTETGDLSAFARRAVLDKVGLIERLASRAAAS